MPSLLFVYHVGFIRIIRVLCALYATVPRRAHLKDRRRLDHSSLGLRVMEKKKEKRSFVRNIRIRRAFFTCHTDMVCVFCT